MTDVITFQIETLKKLISGKELAVPDLSVFLSLVVPEAVVVAQLAIPVAKWAYDELKERGVIPK